MEFTLISSIQTGASVAPNILFRPVVPMPTFFLCFHLAAPLSPPDELQQGRITYIKTLWRPSSHHFLLTTPLTRTGAFLLSPPRAVPRRLPYFSPSLFSFRCAHSPKLCWMPLMELSNPSHICLVTSPLHLKLRDGGKTLAYNPDWRYRHNIPH